MRYLCRNCSGFVEGTCNYDQDYLHCACARLSEVSNIFSKILFGVLIILAFVLAALHEVFSDIFGIFSIFKKK